MSLVALTAFGQVIDERRFREAGFLDHHLTKPVDIEALVTLIGQVPPPQAWGTGGEHFLVPLC